MLDIIKKFYNKVGTTYKITQDIDKVFKKNDIVELIGQENDYYLSKISGELNYSLPYNFRNKCTNEYSWMFINDLPFLEVLGISSWEQQYKNLVKELIEDGIDRDDRTGVGTLNLFNKQIIIDYKDNQNLLPILTLRKIKWENAFHELIFMLNGNTQTKELEKKGVNIWKGNTSKEFIKSRGLDHLLEEGQMGYIYGYNLRRFGNRYDQLKNLFKELENNPLSRRLTLTTHDPSTVPFSVLPSCHGVFQQFFYSPKDNSLSLKQTQRSCDIILGFPTNVIYYSLFLQLTAKCFNMNVGKLIMDLNDVHIYKNHIEKSKKMLERDLIEPPTFELNKDIKSLDDILDLSIDNIDVLSYNHHKGLLFEMAV